jgi:hypothetical protein
MWLPGSEIGNTRGAFCHINRMVTFTTRQTGRSHYLNLDPDPTPQPDPELEKCLGWGRLSNNIAGPGIALGGMLPVNAHDAAQRKVYHVRGHFDLATRTHAQLYTWPGISYGVKWAFDPLRRMIVSPKVTAQIVSPTPDPAYKQAVSGLVGVKVDSSTTFVSLPLIGDTPWINGEAYMGGFVYIPELDEFYFYSQGWTDAAVGYRNPQSVWRIRPPSPLLDPFTNDWELTKITMVGATVRNDTGGRGNYGRFAWNAALRCLVIYNGWTSPNIYLYRPEGI